MPRALGQDSRKHHRGGTVGNARGARGGDGAVLLEGRLQRRRSSSTSSVEGVSSLSTTTHLALAAAWRDGRDSRPQIGRRCDRRPAARCTDSAREFVLHLARELVALRGGLGKAAHQLDRPRGSAGHRRTCGRALPGGPCGSPSAPWAAGRAHWSWIRGRRPRWMSAEPARIWSAPSIMARIAEPHILFTVVPVGAGRQSRAQGCLARRRLAEARRQHAAHDHLVDLAPPRYPESANRRLDGGGAELRSR